MSVFSGLQCVSGQDEHEKAQDGIQLREHSEQIEEGIARAVYPAVYSAIMNAMDKGALTSEVILQGDADKLFKMVRDKDKAYRMATGKSAFAR